jgi:hypothetical protein
MPPGTACRLSYPHFVVFCPIVREHAAFLSVSGDRKPYVEEPEVSSTRQGVRGYNERED